MADQLRQGEFSFTEDDMVDFRKVPKPSPGRFSNPGRPARPCQVGGPNCRYPLQQFPVGAFHCCIQPGNGFRDGIQPHHLGAGAGLYACHRYGCFEALRQCTLGIGCGNRLSYRFRNRPLYVETKPQIRAAGRRFPISRHKYGNCNTHHTCVQE